MKYELQSIFVERNGLDLGVMILFGGGWATRSMKSICNTENQIVDPHHNITLIYKTQIYFHCVLLCHHLTQHRGHVQHVLMQ